MATIDTPHEHQDSPEPRSLDALRAQRINESEDSAEIEALRDADFAHYRLNLWAHPAALTHIIDTILKDTRGEPDSKAPSAKRLRDLLSDPKFDTLPNGQPDPFDDNFAATFERATTPAQVEAITALQKLNRITLSGELDGFHFNVHTPGIAKAILDDKSEHT